MFVYDFTFQLSPHTEACNAFVRERCFGNWEVAFIIFIWHFLDQTNIIQISHKCQGYLDEDGGRRPGHLVLYPIEVGSQPFPQQFLENHIFRFLLMEKSPQCRTSSRTQQLLSKELRAHIFRGSSPHKMAWTEFNY